MSRKVKMWKGEKEEDNKCRVRVPSFTIPCSRVKPPKSNVALIEFRS